MGGFFVGLMIGWILGGVVVPLAAIFLLARFMSYGPKRKFRAF